MQPGKFFIEKYLLSREQWNYLNNYYPWYIEGKKRIYYQPRLKGLALYKKLKKIEAYRTRGS